MKSGKSSIFNNSFTRNRQNSRTAMCKKKKKRPYLRDDQNLNTDWIYDGIK